MVNLEQQDRDCEKQPLKESEMFNLEKRRFREIGSLSKSMLGCYRWFWRSELRPDLLEYFQWWGVHYGVKQPVPLLHCSVRKLYCTNTYFSMPSSYSLICSLESHRPNLIPSSPVTGWNETLRGIVREI